MARPSQKPQSFSDIMIEVIDIEAVNLKALPF